VKRLLGAPLMVSLLAACAPAVTPGTPPPRLTPTACEKRALMAGQAPDVASPEAVAESLRWGVLAPETCPESAGRLILGPPWGRR
jgi:hypothetical protein